MAGLRSFVAVELNEEARRELSRVQDLLKRSNADVKWVDPGNLHFTLKFLGDVAAERLEPLVVALRGGVGDGWTGGGPFELALAGVGAFPSGSSPRVIWVGVGRGRDELGALAARVEAALVPLGFPPEKRGFAPHLTLGRCRSSRNQAALVAAMAALRDYSGPRALVRRVVLFSSELRPTGPLYRPIATCAFAPSAQGSGRGEVE